MAGADEPSRVILIGDLCSPLPQTNLPRVSTLSRNRSFSLLRDAEISAPPPRPSSFQVRRTPSLSFPTPVRSSTSAHAAAGSSSTSSSTSSSSTSIASLQTSSASFPPAPSIPIPPSSPSASSPPSSPHHSPSPPLSSSTESLPSPPRQRAAAPAGWPQASSPWEQAKPKHRQQPQQQQGNGRDQKMPSSIFSSPMLGKMDLKIKSARCSVDMASCFGCFSSVELCPSVSTLALDEHNDPFFQTEVAYFSAEPSWQEECQARLPHPFCSLRFKVCGLTRRRGQSERADGALDDPAESAALGSPPASPRSPVLSSSRHAVASSNPPIRAASESFRTDGAGEKLAPLGAYVLNLAQLVESANINIGAIASQEALSDRDYITLEYPDIQLTFATLAPLSLSIQLSLEFPLCWLPVYRCLSFCAQDHFDPLLPLVEQLVARNTAEPPLLNPCSLYALRSHVYRLLDRLDEAFLDAMRIVWLHPEDPAGYCLRGLIFLQGGLPDLANANLEAALAHAPSSRYLAFIRDRALQFQSNEPLLHLVAEAETAVMKGDYQSAIQRYDGLFEDHPKLAQYYYDRAYCYFRLRQWESGLRDVRKALELYIFWPAKKINRSGYLLKRGKRNRSFKRRYVIVRHAFLFYYISDQHDIPQGFIPLIYCTIVPGSFKSCSFDIKETEGDRRMYHFKAGSPPEAREWETFLDALCRDQKDSILSSNDITRTVKRWVPQPILVSQLIADSNGSRAIGPLSSNPRDWNPNEIILWLRFSGLNEETRALTVKYLRETQKTVLDLEAPDAKQIGILAFSQRKLLLKRVEELRAAACHPIK